MGENGAGKSPLAKCLFQAYSKAQRSFMSMEKRRLQKQAAL
ncbi:MAG: hypothetical protein ACLTSM_00760 [Eubacterium sp.]